MGKPVYRNLSQEHFRFYDDDASEASSTPLGTQNVALDLDVDDPNNYQQIQGRFSIAQTESGYNQGAFGLQLTAYFSKNGGAYQQLTPNTDALGISLENSIYLNPGTDSTERLSGSYSFITDNNWVTDSNTPTQSCTFPDGATAEAEAVWSIRIWRDNVDDGDYFDIRMYDYGGGSATPLDNYAQTARITISKTNPVWEVEDFRFRLDNGGETDADWISAVNNANARDSLTIRQSTTAFDTDYPIGTVTNQVLYYATKFTVTSDAHFGSALIRGRRVGTPDLYLAVEIWSDDSVNGTPDALIGSSQLFNTANWSTIDVDQVVDFSDSIFIPAGDYWYVTRVYLGTPSDTNYAVLRGTTTALDNATSTDGTNWSSSTGTVRVYTEGLKSLTGTECKGLLPNEIYRLRVVIKNTATAGYGVFVPKLNFSINGLSFSEVPSAATALPILSPSPTNYTATNTTQQIGDGTNPTLVGRLFTDNNVSNLGYQVGGGQEVEYEFPFSIHDGRTAAKKPWGTQYWFRVDNGSTEVTHSQGYPRCSSGLAFWLISAYRWRNDDGSETTATWREALNTPTTIAVDEVVRLRIALRVFAITQSPQKFRLIGFANGSYLGVIGDVSSHEIALTASSNVTNEEATTQQITSTSPYPTDNKNVIETYNTLGYGYGSAQGGSTGAERYLTFGSNPPEIEYEFVLKAVDGNGLNWIDDDEGVIVHAIADKPFLSVALEPTSATETIVKLPVGAVHNYPTFIIGTAGAVNGSATVTGSADASATASVTHYASGTATASATASATGTVQLPSSSATVTGSADASATATVNHFASATATGNAFTSALAAVVHYATALAAGAAFAFGTASVTHYAQASVTGRAYTEADGRLYAYGVASATGNAYASGTASVAHFAVSTVTGSADAAGTASVVHYGVATVTGNAYTTATGQTTGAAVNGSATVTGSADASATASVTHFGVSTVTGNAYTTAEATVNHYAVSTVTGRAYTTAVGSVTHNASATATGSADASGTASVTHFADGTATGSADATATATVVHYATATATGRAYTTAVGSIQGFAYGLATVTGNAYASATASVSHFASATVTGSADASATGLVSVSGSATATGSADASGTASVTHYATATVTGNAYTTAVGSVTGYAYGVATATGNAYASATASVVHYGESTVTGQAFTSAVGSVDTPGSATATGRAYASATATVNHYAVATATGRAYTSAFGTIAGFPVGIATVTGKAYTSATASVVHYAVSLPATGRAYAWGTLWEYKNEGRATATGRAYASGTGSILLEGSVTLPATGNLIHQWDPSTGVNGEYLLDVVGNAHALLGGQDLDSPPQFYDRQNAAFEDRARPPVGSTRRGYRAFQGEDENSWVDDFTYSTPTWRGLNVAGGWGAGGYLLIDPAPLTFTEGLKAFNLSRSITTTDEWIYIDLWHLHPYLIGHSSGINTIGSIKLDGQDALVLNLKEDESEYGLYHDTELYLEVLQGDFTPYTMNLQPADIDERSQFVRWNWNRIQVAAKRGTTNGELHVWINENKICAQTGLTTLNGTAWTGVDLFFQWGDTVGATLYDDQFVWPSFTYDEISYGFIDIRSFTGSLNWANQPLCGNLPSGYLQHEFEWPGGNGRNFTVGGQELFSYHNGFMASFVSNNVPSRSGWGWDVANAFASPLKYTDDPHRLFGTSHYEGAVDYDSAEGPDELDGNYEWWDIKQWIVGPGYSFDAATCRDGTVGSTEAYACVYVCFQEGYRTYGGKAYPNAVICARGNEDSFTGGSEAGVGVYVWEDNGQLKMQAGFSNSPNVFTDPNDQWIGPEVIIERERIYKVEIKAYGAKTTLQDLNGDPADWSDELQLQWWLDGELQNITDTGPATRPVGSYGFICFRWVHYYGEKDAWHADGSQEMTVRYYYFYGAFKDRVGGPVGELQSDYKDPSWLTSPARLGLNQTSWSHHEHVKLPVLDKDYFWVGDDRSDWTMAFVVKCDDYTKQGQYLLDGWEGLFDNNLVSVAYTGGPSIRRPKGGGQYSVGTAAAGKIQVAMFGTSWITVADTPTDNDWHTLVVSVQPRSNLVFRAWLDGTLVYTSTVDPPDLMQSGRWHARVHNGYYRKQYVALFDACDAGEWMRNHENGWSASSGCNTHYGYFVGESGPVLFWDRLLMDNEVAQLHAHLRETYTALPAGPSVQGANAPTPANVTVAVDSGIIKVDWDDVTDFGEVRFEVQISDRTGNIWTSVADISDGEPGGVNSFSFSARPRPAGTGYKVRVRAFNGAGFSNWGTSSAFEIAEWAGFLLQSPIRGGGWYDGFTEYPGSRLGREFFCYNADNSIPYGDPNHPNTGWDVNDAYYYEAPVGRTIKAIHFYDLKIKPDVDYAVIWTYDPADGYWRSYVDVTWDRESYSRADWPLQGWWGQHWVRLAASGNPTRVAISISSYEHNSWYQDRGFTGLAVDSVLLDDDTTDNPTDEPEEPPDMSIPAECAQYQEIWLNKPNLKDYETGFVPGDTHIYSRTLYGIPTGVSAASAEFVIREYAGGPTILEATPVPFDNGDGSADVTVTLDAATTRLIGAVDARHYQLRVTLSSGVIITANAGIIKGDSAEEIPVP